MDQQIHELIEATRLQTQTESERIKLEKERIALEQERYEIDKNKLKRLEAIYETVSNVQSLLQGDITPDIRRMAQWINLLLEIQRVMVSRILVDEVESDKFYDLIRMLKNPEINLNFSKEVDTVIGQKK